MEELLTFVRESLRPRSLLSLALIWLGVYGLFRMLHGTRGEGILKGLVVFIAVILLGVIMIVEGLGLRQLEAAVRALPMIFVLVLVVVFQAELRRGLMQLGQAPFLRRFAREESAIIGEISRAVFRLSKKRIGVLIAIEREIGLGTYVEGGVPVDAEVTSHLLETVFHPGTALHDGAIVIRQDRLAAAGCLFPLTDNPEVSRTLGTRHRAAIGLTEESDAVTVVVSEDSGKVSLGVRGQLRQDLTREELESTLAELLMGGNAGRTADEAAAEASADEPAGAGAGG